MKQATSPLLRPGPAAPLSSRRWLVIQSQFTTEEDTFRYTSQLSLIHILHDLIHCAAGLALAASALLILFGIFLTPAVLRLMNTPEDIMDLAVAYIRIYFLSMLPMVFYNIGSGTDIIKNHGEHTEKINSDVGNGQIHDIFRRIHQTQHSRREKYTEQNQQGRGRQRQSRRAMNQIMQDVYKRQL